MSDQQGLSIFESSGSQQGSGQAPSSTPGVGDAFPVVRRGGYDRDAVDQYLQRQSSEVERAAG